MKRLFVGMTALAVAGMAVAEGPGAVRKRVEASMLLTGDIVVTPAGTVASYTLDKADKVPADIASLVHDTAAAWRFEPVIVDGHPVNARAHMSLRVVARHEDPNSTGFVARVAGATFGDDAKEGEQIAYADHRPPSYPANAIGAHVEGTVILVMKIGRDGKVVDVAAEQVNLGTVGSDSDLRVWRKSLANPSVQAARNWTFTVPTTGPHANDPFYVVRAPITFALDRTGDRYGKWEVYVPGPKETAEWAKEDRKDGGSSDAVTDGQLSLVGTGLKLITPVGQS
jgi:hypothetical protein